MDDHKQKTNIGLSLPSYARLPINRCNLPSVILGSLTYQKHPVRLYLDGLLELHTELFNSLEPVADCAVRANNFRTYMSSSFLLDHLDEAGFDLKSSKCPRGKADYLRILRGWLFDSEGMEAAVLKAWVESRFGLLARYHGGPLGDFSGENYQAYLSARSSGLYNTNALETQIDLLYSYCQYEISRQYLEQSHITLYRGTNRLDEYEILHKESRNSYIMILNNLNSFSGGRERADEFGDYILEVEVPMAKLLYMPALLPDVLKGEDEYLVIGGVYQVDVKMI